MLLLTVVGVVVAVLLLRCVAHVAHVARVAHAADVASLLLPSRLFEGRRFVAIRRVVIPKKLLNIIFCKD